MKIECIGCGVTIKSKNLNLDTMMGHCEHCNSITSFSSLVQENRSEVMKSSAIRPQIDIEDIGSIKIEETHNAYQITRKWYSHAVFAMLVFVIFWDGFLVVWYSMAFSDADSPLMVKLFSIVLVAIGLSLTYAVICSFINKTVIRLDTQKLTVKHGPIPWFGNRKISALNIRQLYVKEKVHRGSDSTTYSYNLNVITNDDRDIKLLSRIDDPEQARAIEQVLEKQLGIKDQAVVGEHLLEKNLDM
ncbi:hypothetical protein JD969_14775 [Planctomycetota bacterium]|nr:hypothetical protein JD969_14775 [Planctomycetota bacterium]